MEPRAIRHKTDEEIARIARGDPDSYAYLVHRYNKKLENYLRRITNANREDIEDLLQDIFIKAYRNLNGFDDRLKFSSWIYRIAHNEAISFYRKNRKHRDNLSLDDDNGLSNILSHKTNLVQEINARYDAAAIHAALQQIKSKYREVIILRYFEEKEYTEISDILKMPPGTVATLLNRGKKALKKSLIKLNLTPHER